MEISPVALRFQAEHPLRSLPAIADLTADGAAGCIVAAFSRDEAPAGVTKSQLLRLDPQPPLTPT